MSEPIAITLTIGAYALALFIQRKTKQNWLHPIPIAALLILGVLFAFQTSPETYHQNAHWLEMLLLPATVSLAIPLYEKRALLRKNLLAIGVGALSSVLCSLFCIWLMMKLMNLDHKLYVSLLPKSVTSAIGMPLSALHGGSPMLSVTIIILSGCWGGMIGPQLLHRFGIQEPIAQGLAIGASSHAIGTTRALAMGAVQGAVSGLAVSICGLFTSAFLPLLL